jgi:hypothetical protein
VTIRNPLVVPVDSSSLVQWKRDLSAKYKAKGKSLTSKLIKAGYDAIVTWNTEYNEAGEIVILNTSTLKQV